MTSQEAPLLTIHTDGACLGNPGPGGWAAVLVYGDTRKEISGGFSRTTNNRMEILAVIMALEALNRPSRGTLYSDSKYFLDALNKGWLKNWKRNGWKTAAKKPVKNRDLWMRLDPLLQKHDLELKWVKGHSGDPENERCDELAKAAAMAAGLLPDPGYEGAG
jgi:ribonuclease HI